MKQIYCKEPQYYAGPYVPSGVLYGIGWPSECKWLVPGWNIDNPIHQINLHDKSFEGYYGN